jgi:D-amino-acid dehydrogenase
MTRPSSATCSQIVALGAYSHAALKDMVNSTGIEYHRLERGIAHYYTDAASFETAGAAAELMRRHGVRAAWSAATSC